MINVKDFGAVGDQVTDDTAAIQAAFDEAERSGADAVFFPRGTYRLSKGTAASGGISIVGDTP